MSNSEPTKKSTKTKAENAADAVDEKKENDQEVIMYVGPTIAGVASQNVVYDGIPDGLVEVSKEIPEMRNLCIPVIKYAEAEKMIREKKGYIWSAYKKALEYKEGGK